MKAEVKLACGRWFVSLGGLVIAMETDPARDPHVNGNRYDKENLEQLAELINARLTAPAELGSLNIVRANAIQEILTERESQDKIWRDSAFPTMNAQYDYAAPHILVIEECVSKLRKIWYGSKDEGTLRERFVKIAACALRALEEIKHTRG